MPLSSSNSASRFLLVGKTACRAIFVLGIVYAITTLLGLLSLESPHVPIGNPYFVIMEILTILIASLMVIATAAIHTYASPEHKVYSLAAVCFMVIVAGITSIVHFVILAVGHQVDTGETTGFSFLLSFSWPSVAYALDILAWDWFFATSILMAAPVFRRGKLEKIVRTLMIICGILSLTGLIGVPLANMQIRDIGIIGYAVIAPVVFLLIGVILGRAAAPGTV
jgi:hypothetical protein